MTTFADADPPEQESRYHTYSSHVIPWYVRLIWLSFWLFAIAYAVTHFLPSLQTELLAPP